MRDLLSWAGPTSLSGRLARNDKSHEGRVLYQALEMYLLLSQARTENINMDYCTSNFSSKFITDYGSICIILAPLHKSQPHTRQGFLKELSIQDTHSPSARNLRTMSTKGGVTTDSFIYSLPTGLVRKEAWFSGFTMGSHVICLA